MTSAKLANMTETWAKLTAETGGTEKANGALEESRQNPLLRRNQLQSKVDGIKKQTGDKESQVLEKGEEKEETELELRAYIEELQLRKDLLRSEFCQEEEERKKLARESKQKSANVELLAKK